MVSHRRSLVHFCFFSRSQKDPNLWNVHTRPSCTVMRLGYGLQRGVNVRNGIYWSYLESNWLYWYWSSPCECVALRAHTLIWNGDDAHETKVSPSPQTPPMPLNENTLLRMNRCSDTDMNKGRLIYFAVLESFFRGGAAFGCNKKTSSKQEDLTSDHIERAQGTKKRTVPCCEGGFTQRSVILSNCDVTWRYKATRTCRM